MRRPVPFLLLALLAAFSQKATADPTGLINMPSGRMDPDGTLRLGLSYAYPYQEISANATLLPFLETNLGVTGIKNVFLGDIPYGQYKDKTTGFKLKVFDEEKWWPSLVVGAQDFIGTRLSERRFVAASKSFGDVDLTLGYGSKLISGAFGGVRYSPSALPNWSAVAEYDASNFKNFAFSNLTGVSERTPGMSYALEYRWGWITTALSRQRGVNGLSTYVAVPLNERWIPHFVEPEPYTKVIPRPTLAQWRDSSTYQIRLAEALARQDFQDIRINLDASGRLDVTLTNSRISKMSRAVGRAARTALLLSPIDSTQIRITYTANTLPVATYEFFDLQKLNRYFNGMLTRKLLAEYVAVRYANPADYQESQSELMDGMSDAVQSNVLYGDDGNLVSLRSRDILLNNFQIKPLLQTYLNGPGAFQYTLSAYANYDRRLGRHTFLAVGISLPIAETISKEGAANPDNTTLPVVRSDLPEYHKGHQLKLAKLVINQFQQLSERTYGRLSGGFYEEMYAGVGGQWLYVPSKAGWAFDLSVDALKKRAPDERFSFQDYKTVTAIGALHYKMPYQSTATIRMGRFLAKDLGARFEIKRRFDSGMELGAWYTLTNANDRGGPASQEGGVYYDKGIFFSIPFSALLGKDTRAVGNYALSPWGRDPGQLVGSPADLYSIIERPLMVDMPYRDGMVQFGDVDDEYDLPDLGSSLLDRPFERIGGMILNDIGAGAGTGTLAGKLDQALVGAGLVLGSALSDKKTDDFIKRHQDNKWVRKADSIGKNLPLLGMGLAGMAFLSADDKRLSTTGLAALQAGGIGLLGNTGIKKAVGRARPLDELGTHDFEPMKRADASFGSNHTIVSWAAVTPFAREYEVPWLYGVAAMTNIGRVTSRQHWVSDTVASSLLGYVIGSFFWDQRRKPAESGPQLGVNPTGVSVSWPLK